MITLREETVTCIPNIYVAKRDGRRDFDVDKIYKALVKAAQKWRPCLLYLSCLRESRRRLLLKSLMFFSGCEDCEIQTSLSMSLNANEYAS